MPLFNHTTNVRSEKQTGFTIVELLIVIVVIAILAAITIVAYNGIQNRANDTAVQNDLSSFAKKLETVKIDNDDAYPTNLTASMGFQFSKNSYQGDDYGATPKNNTLDYCVNQSTNQYIMYARSKSGTYFKYVSGSGVSTAIPASGWGVCSQIGLVNTNPSSDGYKNGVWQSWVN